MGQLVKYSSVFVYLGNLLIPPSSLQDTESLLTYFSFITLLLTSMVFGVKFIVNLIEDLLLHFYCFQDSLCVAFHNLTVSFLDVNLFEFILLGNFWASWLYRFMSFIKFGKILVIVSSDIFPVPFSLSLLWDSHYVRMLDGVSQVP